MKSKHGHLQEGKQSPTYRSWVMMTSHCTNPNYKQWKDYGGRGIRVCGRWQNFENFLADMGERPAGMTLDRYPNNDGDYEPGNCRWATRKEQAQNRRNHSDARLLRCYSGPKGEKTIAEWAEITGGYRQKISNRIRRGWPHKQAVFGKLTK